MKIDEKILRDKIRNGLSTIKVQLGFTPPDTDNAYTLADGTIIKVSGPLEVNSTVQVVTAAGVSPIPDGEYVVCNAQGTQVTITTVAGNITHIETPMQQQDDTAFQAHETLLKQTLARVDKLEVAQAAYRQSFAQAVSLLELVAQQPAQPAAEPPLNNGWAGKKNKPNTLDVIRILKQVNN